ncbi:hypothetical protein NQZ68_035328 [Dissostichus eleginoides]|nr:hypothetical protein NQZ68_035328 [Dissostichus eleginoides]
MDKFQSQQKQWLSSMDKNRIKSHVLDDAALLWYVLASILATSLIPTPCKSHCQTKQ